MLHHAVYAPRYKDLVACGGQILAVQPDDLHLRFLRDAVAVGIRHGGGNAVFGGGAIPASQLAGDILDAAGINDGGRIALLQVSEGGAGKTGREEKGKDGHRDAQRCP